MKIVESPVQSSAVSAPASRQQGVKLSLSVNPEILEAAHRTIEKEFASRCPQSLLLHDRAAKVFPGGVTHDNRHLAGPSLFVRKAKGARKMDQDGNQYVDYWVGHGALLLGHGRKEVIEAIHLAAQDATHPGACHEREVMWAEQVKTMVPSAERIRFTASGSESSALAFRLARAMTGKSVILKFEGHFHGWLDHAVEGVDLPFETPWSCGVPEQVRALTRVLPARHLKAVEAELNSRDDVAGIILEPTGASGGTIPLRPDFLHGLRALANRHHVALIFDEVITGFRLAPGGAQERFNVLPDITCLAKVLAGGLAGGAVCGTREAFAAMEFSGVSSRDRNRRVAQYGTFNANPLSAGAGVATLKIIANSDACQKAEAYAKHLKDGLNALFQREVLGWAAYGFSSVFHILTSDPCTGQILRDGVIDAADVDPVILKQKGPLDALLRRILVLEGIDLPPGRQAWVSAAHGADDLEKTLDAFARAIARLRALKCL